MKHTLTLAQLTISSDPLENLKQAQAAVKRAVLDHAEAVIFPENFMLSAKSRTEFVIKSQPLDGPFVTAMAELARRSGCYLIFGINESAKGVSTHCYNTIVILDDQGQLAGAYRKTHLFDAFHAQESAYTLPGDTLFSPLDTPFGRLGLLTCYELRFPEIPRHAALNGAELIIVPAAWHEGLHKRFQWQTLLQARAIENACFVVGCTQYAPNAMTGFSLAADPLGLPIAKAADAPACFSFTYDLSDIADARETVPVFAHRHPQLYPQD